MRRFSGAVLVAAAASVATATDASADPAVPATDDAAGGSGAEAAAENGTQDVAAEPAATAEPAPERVAPSTCTYSTYAWSSSEGRAVDHRRVSKAYADVTDDERSPLDPRCTVCEEDQRWVRVDGVEATQVCWAYADAVHGALENIVATGAFDVREFVGYRPGRTRGAIVDGRRTGWSNHAFGTAVDLNASHNGLYRGCAVAEVTPQTIRGCQLGVGGAWDPARNPRLTIDRDGVVYDQFVNVVGWRWGGEIAGATRDLMHFSLDGY